MFSPCMRAIYGYSPRLLWDPSDDKGVSFLRYTCSLHHEAETRPRGGVPVVMVVSGGVIQAFLTGWFEFSTLV